MEKNIKIIKEVLSYNSKKIDRIIALMIETNPQNTMFEDEILEVKKDLERLITRGEEC